MTPRGKVIVVWRAENEKHRTVSFVGSATQAAGGADWTKPVGIRGSYEAEGLQLALSPAGEAAAIWGATHTPGRRWRVKSLAPQDYGTDPTIMTEPGGRATVLWSNFVSPEEGEVVSSSHSPGSGWSEPRSLAAEGLQLSSPSESQIAVTQEGESIALWVADGPRGKRTNILSSSRHRPQPWSEPQQVPTSPCGQLYGAPAPALAPDGKAFAVWRCFNGNRWVIKAASRPAARPGP